MECLLLSNGYEPIDRIPWEKAISKWLNGAVEVLEWTDHLVWSGVRKIAGRVYEQVFRPSVVRLLKNISRKRSVKFSRENIYLRDKGKCQYCGIKLSKKQTTLDHVVPRSLGGKTTWENIVISCFDCNQEKRNRTLQQSGMKLRSRPEKPKSLPFTATMRMILGRTTNIPDEWTSYIYWNVELDQD